jgi:hypothetical protein
MRGNHIALGTKHGKEKHGRVLWIKLIGSGQNHRISYPVSRLPVRREYKITNPAVHNVYHVHENRQDK